MPAPAPNAATDVTRAPARRVRAGLAKSLAHLREVVPPAPDRCGTPILAGAARMLAADLGRAVAHRTGALVSLPDGGRLGVDLATPHGRRWFAWGCCEPATWAMRTLAGPGDVVIDAGANIGLFSLIAAARVGAHGRVVACEPVPGTMALLRANVARNRYHWVELHEVAVAETPGRLELEDLGAGSGLSSFAPAQAGRGRRIEVAVTTLDELAGDDLSRTRVVKLDVEGAELRALRGATRLLETARPDFIVELEPEHLERQGGSIQELQSLFERSNYVAYAVAGQTLQPLLGSWRRDGADPNVVIRPRERTAP